VLWAVVYLAREGYLKPTYSPGAIRGRVRYYSYRDLVIARIIRKLTATGLELKRLKRGLKTLAEDATWREADQLHLLATDGRNVYFQMKDGSLLDLEPSMQKSFAFVLDVAKAQEEAKGAIDSERRERFSLQNHPLIYSSGQKQAGR
jgi:DNA-binding transcriptional MerR regulator